jgi:hypothetical protein
MKQPPISMVQECTDSYRVEEQDDGGVVVTIRIPKRFSELWMMKLSELRTTQSEINEFDPKN